MAGNQNDPPGFSGVKKWLSPKLAVPVLIAAAVFALTRPTSVASHASPITAADVASLVATTPQPTPKATVAPTAPPMPTMPPTPPQLAVNDVAAQQPPSGAANNAAVQVQATPTAPPTISPAEAARQRRMAEDLAALEAPVTTSPMMLSPVKVATSTSTAKPADDLWLRAGMTIGPLTLYTSGKSDLPELLVAYLGEPLFDSTHRHMIAPRGAKMICKYGSGGSVTISQNQDHLPANCFELQLDDRVIALGDDPAIDPTGTSGIGASVNRHTASGLKNLVLLTALGALLNRGSNCGQNCAQSYGNNSSSVGGAVVAAGQQTLSQGGQQPPTLGVPEGDQFSVMVVQDVRVQEWRP